MKNKKPHDLMDEAIVLLDRANNELNRPSGDVVFFAACNMAKDSMRMMLSAFLLKNNVDFNENDSLDNLKNISKEIMPDLKNISLKAVNCSVNAKDEDKHYCLSVNQVCGCVACANNLKSIFKSE